jgi:hypothetical protein
MVYKNSLDKYKMFISKTKSIIRKQTVMESFSDKNNMIDHLSSEEIEPMLNFIDQVLIDPT